jgi:hypothetical protein
MVLCRLYCRVSQGSAQWQAAADLRYAIADLTGNQHIRNMITTPLGTEAQQMGFNALPKVAQYLREHYHKPLVVIDTTHTPQPQFTYYDQNGNHGLATTFQAALGATTTRPEETRIVLQYSSGHWNSVIDPNAQHPVDDSSGGCTCLPV